MENRSCAEKYRYGTGEEREFLRGMRDDLFAFGRLAASPGGSSWYLGDDGSPRKERARETWITARMAHVYSLAVLLGKEEYRNTAAAAVRGLRGELHDEKNGGWYAGLAADGRIIPSKQCYAHAFVILAGSSGMLAGIPEAEDLFREALAVYDERFWDEEEGLALDTWNTEFTVPDDYRGLNANMHSAEAFLAAADAAGLEEYRRRTGRIIQRVLFFAENNDFRIPEHYTRFWEPDLSCGREKPDDPFKPYGATPGHGIEWARLIIQWACSTFPCEEDRKPCIDAAAKLYGRAAEDGWHADGAPGFVYTTDWDGTPVVHDRMHWTLAEGINTASVLYRVTGEEKYAEDYAVFLRYLDEKVLDRRYGSWYHQLDEKNRLLDTVWPGKPDLYHAVQACLIPFCDPSLSVAASLKKGR